MGNGKCGLITDADGGDDDEVTPSGWTFIPILIIQSIVWFFTQASSSLVSKVIFLLLAQLTFSFIVEQMPFPLPQSPYLHLDHIPDTDVQSNYGIQLLEQEMCSYLIYVEAVERYKLQGRSEVQEHTYIGIHRRR